MGGERHIDVPLVGVDLHADIALLGPIVTDVEPIVVGDPVLLSQGDPVFLVGYPGELEKDPDPAISQGILSRTRSLGGWDLDYLQTDASIGGGQSGGALVDSRGRVVGVSGLRFAESFGLALDITDVEASIGQIRAGATDGPVVWPTDADGSVRAELTFEATDDLGGVVAVAASPDARLVDVRVTGASVAVVAVGYSGDELGASPAFGELMNRAAAATGTSVEEFYGGPLPPSGVVREPEPNRFQMDVPARGLVFLAIVPTDTDAGTLVVESNLAIRAVDMDLTPRPVSVGDEVRGTSGPMENSDIFTVHLEAGEKVTMAARSVAGNMALAVRGPDQDWDDATYVDDSDEGLYGLDAVVDYTAETAGIHEIEVANLDPYANGYRLSVKAAG